MQKNIHENNVPIYDKVFLLKDIIIMQGINNQKLHLTEEEFRGVLKLYSVGRVTDEYRFIRVNLGVYKKTIQTFKDINTWEEAPSESKILRFEGKGSAVYYYTMLLCGRIKPDWNILNGYYTLPDVLSEEEKKKIIDTAILLDYKEQTYRNIVYFIEKIMICTDKKLIEVDDNDIYFFRNSNCKPSIAKATFYVLKYIGNINELSTYDTNGRDNIVNVFAFNVDSENKGIMKYYNEFLYDIRNKASVKKQEEKITATKRFMIWLWEVHKEIDRYQKLTFENLEEYSEWLKKTESKKTRKKYAKKTIVTSLSNLKAFISFLSKKNLFSNKFNEQLPFYNDLYFKNYKSKTFPKPVSMQDRKYIEKIIYEFDYLVNPLVPKMLKLLYLLGLRPSELLSLKWDCLKGNENVPLLHVHRAKNYKERFIPLTSEAYAIILELREFNKNSLPVYFDYDNLSVKRLFCYRGEIITEFSLNEIFKNLLIRNGLFSPSKEAKYTLYILRKIRITTWLEAGISDDDVAYLVGHGCVDSHNFYIISKERRIANAQKLYNKYYKNLYEEVCKNGNYNISENSSEVSDDNSYLLKLQEMIAQIEMKNINRLSMESIIRSFPELLFPVPCGKCFAMAVLGNDYECERMKFPCLECTEFIDAENHIQDFDNFVIRLYESRHMHIKAGLDGLVERDNTLLERLKKFYIQKYDITENELDIRFNEFKKSTLSKRGRPKKIHTS